MRRLAVDPGAGLTFLAAMEEAAAVIGGGGVVGFPTDTLYGLAVDPFNRHAVDRLFRVKGRAAEHVAALVAADVEQVERWIAPVSGVARRLAEAFWPGPLTVLLRPVASHRRPDDAGADVGREPAVGPPPLAAGVVAVDGTVGVRVPAHAIATAFCRAAGRPLTATSANISGEPATPDPAVVWRMLGSRLDLLLDGGSAPGGPPSTLVDVSGAELRLVRAGAIAWETIQRCVT